MTSFECTNGHRFPAPVSSTTAGGSRLYGCPECGVTGFKVVELGGAVNQLDDSCEGACTL